MKKFFGIIIFIICISVFLNASVTRKQCINYQCSIKVLPLYLKVLDFFDRHYNYKYLTRSIVKNSGTKEERALNILEWTYKNIKRNPEILPVLDDHIWYTIIRGYAVDDQFHDIFSTLCNYAGIDAFFAWVYSKDNQSRKTFAFAKIKKEWSVFDVYNGVYFINARKEMATISDLLRGKWRAVSLSGSPNIGIDDYYAAYFVNLNSVDFQNWKTTRAALQSPINRLIFLKKRNRK